MLFPIASLSRKTRSDFFPFLERCLLFCCSTRPSTDLLRGFQWKLFDCQEYCDFGLLIILRKSSPRNELVNIFYILHTTGVYICCQFLKWKAYLLAEIISSLRWLIYHHPFLPTLGSWRLLVLTLFSNFLPISDLLTKS